MSTNVMPVGSLSRDQVRSILTAAAAVPSARDADSWRLDCTPTAFELRADLPGPAGMVDECRERLLSGGAALLNLRVAVRSLGVHPAVRLMPDAAEPDLLAVVRPQGGIPATPTDRDLAQAIAPGQSNGRASGACAIPLPLVNRLRQAARIEQTWMAVLPSTQLRALGGLAGRVESADVDGPESLVAVIGSFHDVPLAWLQAGQGTQRVLLTATAAGLHAAPMPQMVNLPRVRRQLRRLIGGGLWPQAVMRLGESPAIGSVRRRDPREGNARHPARRLPRVQCPDSAAAVRAGGSVTADYEE